MYTGRYACGISLLSGCGKSAETSDNNTKTVKSVRLETGDITQNSVVMKIGNTGVKYEEVLNYAYLLKNQYEGSFGKALWSYKIDDDTNIGDKAKKEIVSMITQLKIIGENAAKQGITLDGDEKDQALQDAQKLSIRQIKKKRKSMRLLFRMCRGCLRTISLPIKCSMLPQMRQIQMSLMMRQNRLKSSI